MVLVFLLRWCGKQNYFFYFKKIIFYYFYYFFFSFLYFSFYIFCFNFFVSISSSIHLTCFRFLHFLYIVQQIKTQHVKTTKNSTKNKRSNFSLLNVKNTEYSKPEVVANRKRCHLLPSGSYFSSLETRRSVFAPVFSSN